MKRLKWFWALAAGFMLLSTAPAWALDADFHVKQAPNNKGDLLFYPLYYADDGYSTELTVVNTSNTESTVAKVIVKSRDWSEELIDFLVYLSPNDMWTGKLYWKGESGANRSDVAVYSEDDSVITSSVAPAEVLEADFANAGNPFDFNLFTTSCPGDTERIGYVEVINSRTTDSLEKNIDGVVPKTEIYKWYHGPNASNPFSVEPSAENAPPENILAGWMEVSKPTTGMSASMRADTFRDWVNTYPLTTAELSGIQFDSLNTIAELEAAMAKANIAMPYVNYAGTKTYHAFNFPTKMSLEDGTCENYEGWEESPYFAGFDRDEVMNADIYNMKEETISPDAGDPISGGDDPDPREIDKEVTYVNTEDIELPFNEGWIRYNFGRTGDVKTGLTLVEETIEYLGTPVLPAILTFDNNGMSLMKAAHDDGSVAIDDERLQYYQYSDGGRPE